MACMMQLPLSLLGLIATSLATDPYTELIDQFTCAARETSAGREFLIRAGKYEDDEFPDTTPEDNSAYDFVVVGGGSAGAIVASRISEMSNVTVLLIEAGGNETLNTDIPLIAAKIELSDNNWNYTTTPSDSYCLGMTNRQCRWARGKVMGGSGVLNAMLANRGHPANYDNWAKLKNTGWSFEDVLPYFKKLENMTIPKFREDEELHGTNGPINIAYARFHSDLSASFVRAAKDLGYRTDYDYNGRTQNGFSLPQTNTENGSRWSSNRAYLHPARNRSNLFASKKSLVRKVLIDSEEKRAYGVEFIKRNKIITVNARKEVILCAGAIGSPQLLMLSGIGPKEHLTEKNITVIQDTAVGENLMDHVSFSGLVFLANQTIVAPAADALNPASSYFEEYVTNNGAGPLSIPYYTEAFGFMNVDDPLETDGLPNMEILFSSGSVAMSPESKLVYGYSDSTWNQTYQSIEGLNSWALFPMLLTPVSRGRILLENNDINTHPKIIPNYFSDEEDFRILIKGIKKAIEIGESHVLRKYGTQLHKASIPGCEDDEYGSDSYWKCALRSLTFTIWHPSGTCRMGPEDNSSSVVNPQLQVIGVKGLRVADASIMPVIPTTHTNIPTMMIAEKLSDMIKESYGFPI